MMAWYNHAKVGDKVAAREDAIFEPSNGETAPEHGRIYTIRWIGPIPSDAEMCLRFDEIINRQMVYNEMFGEAVFPAILFRPIQTKSTESGMQILRGLLDTTKQPIKEDA
jgi:hypothetical protein